MKNNFENDFDKYQSYLLSLGFFKVYKDGCFIDINDTNKGIYLTHKPTDCKKDCFNLFGHIHEKNFVKRFGLNVGIDCFHYKPATVDDVLFYKNAIQNYYDEDVFCEK